MASELVRQLIESGIHFGHRASRWNPKMRPYIFGKRNAVHIIDIRETVKGLLRAKKFLTQVVASGKDVLFVGTKRQARPHILAQAQRVNMPYVAERWLGGTLTNFRTIRSRLARLEELEAAEADGTAQEYSKKMIASRTRELRKIRRNLEGIRNMDKLPGALVVIDVHRERNAVREAKKMGIPTVCLIDTDSDPDYADLPIPGNDDAMRAIGLVLTQLADAVEEGLKARADMAAKEAEEAQAEARRRARAQMSAESGSSEESSAGTEPAAPTSSGESEQQPGADLAPAQAGDPEPSS
ncbi:MAG: 30S ribosomal protein S2 [Planctomycetota bacterium]|nr:MAG: 30S ribosomal protein S2 [Planctomycetota bacterium]